MSDPNPAANNTLSYNDGAVIKTLEMYQAIITRMAGNSAACKQWCIPLVTAILAFAIKENRYQLMLLTLIPILICYCLDSYYLMLENRFRAGFNQAASKVADGSFTRLDLFRLTPAGCCWRLLLKSYTSLATWPVYMGLLALLAVAYKLPVGGC